MEYEIFLASAFEGCETDGHNYPFYEKLEEKFLENGRRIYLPHKKLISYTKPNIVANERIRRANLVLSDIGIPSTATGMMLRATKEREKPIILFQDSNDPYQNDDLKLEGFIKNYELKRLVFEGKEKGLSMIVDAVEDFFMI